MKVFSNFVLVCLLAFLVAVCLAIIELVIIIYVVIKEDGRSKTSLDFKKLQQNF